ncbi:MAG: heavy metal-responsive transcriptional regulator [Acidimicrobiales bacterium]
MRIGELGDRVGINPKTIRYYESIGLLPAPERQPSGYRDYTADDVERLRFVRTAQRLNLSLSEIAEILRFRERDERPCEYVLDVLDRQVADIDRKMAEMAELRRELISLKAKADQLPRDEGCYCAVIEHSQRAEGEPVTVSSVVGEARVPPRRPGPEGPPVGGIASRDRTR